MRSYGYFLKFYLILFNIHIFILVYRSPLTHCPEFHKLYRSAHGRLKTHHPVRILQSRLNFVYFLILWTPLITGEKMNEKDYTETIIRGQLRFVFRSK